MDAILGFLNNPVFITALQFVFGLVVKYHPSWGKFPNWTIPFLNSIVALLIMLGAPQPVQAGVFGHIAVPGFLGVALSAGWSAIQTSLIYEVFGKGPLHNVLKVQPNTV